MYGEQTASDHCEPEDCMYSSREHLVCGEQERSDVCVGPSVWNEYRLQAVTLVQTRSPFCVQAASSNSTPTCLHLPRHCLHWRLLKAPGAAASYSFDAHSVSDTQTLLVDLVPGISNSTPAVHCAIGLHAGWLASFWYSVSPSHSTHCLFEVNVGRLSSYCPGTQTVVLLHTLSKVHVGSLISCWLPRSHWLSEVHSLLLKGPGATDSKWVVQSHSGRCCLQTVSVVPVQESASYSVAILHVEHAVHPPTSGKYSPTAH